MGRLRPARQARLTLTLTLSLPLTLPLTLTLTLTRRAKLADFGVSAICGEGRAADYVRGTSGTPAFFAPETTLTLSPTPTPTPTLPLTLTLTLTV